MTAVDGAPDRGLLTLGRGLAVLEGIAEGQGTATAKSLSELTNIKLGTCYQLLKTLQLAGYAERRPGGHFALGHRVEVLTRHFEPGAEPPASVMAALSTLSKELGETVYLSLRRDTTIAVAATIEGSSAVRVGPLVIGYSRYPHARASTKCVLAYLAQDDLLRYLNPESLTAVTAATITDWPTLLEELQSVRVKGFARDSEEFREGVVSLSSVIVDRDGRPFGAFGASLPVNRVAERQKEVVAVLHNTARSASESLGFVGQYPPTGPANTA